MKYLPIFLITICCLIGVNKAKAQFMYDRYSRPIDTKIYLDIEGSAYLTESWSPGEVRLVNGTIYKKDILLKYNLLDDELYFKYDTGATMTFVDPVKDFFIKYTYEQDNVPVTKHYRNGYQDVSNTTPKSYFEVIGDGNLQLIKKTTKSVSETKEYNSATKVKAFQDYTRYFLVIAGKTVPVKNDKKSILATIPDKQQQLQTFAKLNNLNFKSDADLAKLMNFYNSL